MAARENYFSHLNRIAAKHVDFLTVRRLQWRPVLAIELDDASHATSARPSRDDLRDEVFHTAGLPLLHMAVGAACSVE